MKRDILGVALCGGESRRMGEDKAKLIVRPGLTQLEYALELLGRVCWRTAAGAGRVDRCEIEGVKVILDAEGVTGPMAGVVAALRLASGWPVLVVACDMPYLEMSHLLLLLNRSDRAKQATAFLAADGRPDPMCALYETSCLPLVESAISDGSYSLRRILERANLERVELPRPELLASVNDRQDLLKARRAKLKGSSAG